jgi:hypothetical protein
MKLKLLSAMLLCWGVSAQAKDWITLQESKSFTWEAQKGSGELSTNKAGKEIFIITARVIDKKTKSIEFSKMYVTLDDCSAKEGKLVTLALQGGVLLRENDFVIGGGTVASEIAGVLCEGPAHRRKADEQKGNTGEDRGPRSEAP